MAVELSRSPARSNQWIHHYGDQEQRRTEAHAQIAPDRSPDARFNVVYVAGADRAPVVPRAQLRHGSAARLMAAERSSSAPIEAWWVRSSCSGVTAM